MAKVFNIAIYFYILKVLRGYSLQIHPGHIEMELTRGTVWF